MARTKPECPICAAVVLRQRADGAASMWDIADRLEAIRRSLDARGALAGSDGAYLQIAADCLRIVEFREGNDA